MSKRFAFTLSTVLLCLTLNLPAHAQTRKPTCLSSGPVSGVLQSVSYTHPNGTALQGYLLIIPATCLVGDDNETTTVSRLFLAQNERTASWLAKSVNQRVTINLKGPVMTTLTAWYPASAQAAALEYEPVN